MKKTFSMVVLVVICIATNAQIANLNVSTDIPESASITDVTIMNPGFKDSFLFLKASGATVFKQKNEISLVDSKTFDVKAVKAFPTYSGHTVKRVRTHNYWNYLSDGSIHDNERGLELDQTLAYLYTSKAGKRYMVSAITIDKSLTFPEKPSSLFLINDEQDHVFYSINYNRTICVLSNETEDKKLKQKTFYYRVYDSKMNLLKADSMISDLKSPDTLKALAYDNGAVLIKNAGKKREVTLIDVKAKAVKTFVISNSNTDLIVDNARLISNEKLVLLGSYSSNVTKKKVNCGIFKIVFNPVASKLEEQVFFDHVRIGKFEDESEAKYVFKSIITETGACYAMVNQLTSFLAMKFELVYIKTNDEKWKRQLPISNALAMPSRTEIVVNSSIDMQVNEGNLFIIYRDYEDENATFDLNNYIFGEPSPSIPKSLRDNYRANLSVLKVDQSGAIQHQRFPRTYYQAVNVVDKYFLGINQEIDGVTYSKCKFVSVALNP